MESPAAGISDLNAETDRQLVRAAATGSTEALGRLYDRHAGVVYALARRILTRLEDAEEVVQDVFAQVWRDAGRYDAGRATVAGWVVMLARARAIDRLRARKSRPDQNLPVDPANAPPATDPARNPEQVAISTQDAQSVRRALEVLPDAQRSLVTLAYFEGLTHMEIAERTGVPLGTVKTRLRMAMASMRDALPSQTR